MTLQILGYIAIFIATLAGVVGVLTDYRDKETNTITIWGKLAVLLIVIAGGVSIASSYIGEKDKVSKEAQSIHNELVKQKEILSEIKSLSYSVQKEYKIEFEFSLDRLSPYYQEMKKIQEALIESNVLPEEARKKSQLALFHSFTQININLSDPDDKEINMTLVSYGGDELHAPIVDHQKSDDSVVVYTSRYPFRLLLNHIGDRVTSLTNFVGKKCKLSFNNKFPAKYRSFSIVDQLGRTLVADDMEDVSNVPLNPNAKTYEGICRI